MSALVLRGVSKRFGDIQALADLDLAAAEGEFFCIVGPTNAGKSTLLKTVAGLYRPDRGSVAIGGRDVTALQPRERRVSLLFQNIALFPTLTGFANIAFPLRTAGWDEAAVQRRVAEIAGFLQIERILDRHPRTFSGGEQQRIAIGRALALPGDLLMLDEPLTNLDARIRTALRIQFKKLHRETGQTILYVTHDQVEAMSLSDRIAVMSEGRLQQVGTPDEIYHRPANRFVAAFIGMPPMNFLPAALAAEGEGFSLAGDGFRVTVPSLAAHGGPAEPPRQVILGLRPEAIGVSPAGTEETPFPGTVFWVERLGSKSILDLRLGGATLKAVVPPDHPVQREGAAWFGFRAQPHHLMDPRTGAFLR